MKLYYLIVVLKRFVTFLTDKQCSNQTRVKIHCHVLMRIICISKTREVSFSWTNFFCYIPHICVDLAWEYNIVLFFRRWCSVIIQGACQEESVGWREDKEQLKHLECPPTINPKSLVCFLPT